MDGDRSEWANPIRAQEAVERIERQLGRLLGEHASGAEVEQLQSGSESQEPPD
jgi:hypothetical protein